MSDGINDADRYERSGHNWMAEHEAQTDRREAELLKENERLTHKHNEQYRAASQLADGVVKLAAERDALKAQVARLNAPVSDEEYHLHFFTANIYDLYYATRKDVNNLIAARLTPGHESVKP